MKNLIIIATSLIVITCLLSQVMPTNFRPVEKAQAAYNKAAKSVSTAQTALTDFAKGK